MLSVLMRRLVLLGCSLASLGLLAVASSASATVTKETAGGTQVTLRSDGAADTIEMACVAGQARTEGVNLVPCTALEDLFIIGAGGNDVVNLANVRAAEFPKLRRIEIDGGEGTDVINGTQLADTITSDGLDIVNGEGGDDQIKEGKQVNGGEGDDTIESPRGPVNGGPGDDLIKGAGNGLLEGGPGHDTFELDLQPASLVLDGLRLDVEDSRLGISVSSEKAEIPWSSIERAVILLVDGSQTVDASRFSGQLEADGRGGADTLIGGPGEDFLFGGAGNDELIGNGGFDYLNGGADSDTLQLRDGETDRGLCGEGVDVANADAVDSLSGCETINLPAAGPAAAGLTPPPSVSARDTTPPDTVGLKGPKKVKRGASVAFTFDSTEAGSSFRCQVDKAATKLCRSPFKVSTKKLTPGKHTFSVAAIDAAGNVDPTPATVKFTVERQGRKAGKP